jgi:hypothetical protein
MQAQAIVVSSGAACPIPRLRRQSGVAQSLFAACSSPMMRLLQDSFGPGQMPMECGELSHQNKTLMSRSAPSAGFCWRRQRASVACVRQGGLTAPVVPA